MYEFQRRILREAEKYQKTNSEYDPIRDGWEGAGETLSERFDSFKIFKYKANAREPDGEYDLRAIVEYTIDIPKAGKGVVFSLFPPAQLRSTDNKYEFNKYLNQYVSDLKSSGHAVIAIHREGDPIYNRMLKGIKEQG